MIEMTNTRRVAIAGNARPMFSGEALLLGDLLARAKDILLQNFEKNLEESCFTSTAATTTASSCLTVETIKDMKRKMEEIKAEILDDHLPLFHRPFPTFNSTPAVLCGMQLIEHPWPKKQARTHRKKRINKKWLKRYGYIVDTSVDTGNAFVFQGRAVIVYPHTFARITAAVRNFPNC